MDAVTIAAPPIRRRPWGLLVQEADELTLAGDGSPIGDRWRAGVTFTPRGCNGLATAEVSFCIDDSDDPLNADPALEECPTFAAFHVYGTESATALDYDATFIDGRLAERYMVTASEQLARRLIEGGGDDTPALALDATVLTQEEGVEASIVLALVEQHLAEKLHGGQGLVWVSPAGLAVLKEYLERIDGHWYTASGHLVVADSGHQDQPPTGETSLDNEGWVYATGLISWKLGEPRFENASATEYLDRTRNVIHGRRVAEGIVAFDPCAAGAAKFRYSDDVVVEGS